MTTHRGRTATDEPRAGEPRTGTPRTGEPGTGAPRAGEPPSPLATALESAVAIVSIAVVGLLSAALSAARL